MNRKDDENRFVTTAEKLTRGVTVIAVTAIEPKSKQQQLEISYPTVVSSVLWQSAQLASPAIEQSTRIRNFKTQRKNGGRWSCWRIWGWIGFCWSFWGCGFGGVWVAHGETRRLCAIESDDECGAVTWVWMA